MSSKNRVTLTTYLKWGKDSVLGKKIIEEDETKFVVKVWCKVCAKYKSEILRGFKGSAETAALAFLDGKENVKSSNVNINFLFHIFQAQRYQISLYVCIHFKIIPWKFCILNPNNSQITYLQILCFP